MKLSAPFLLLAAAIGLVQASGHDGLSRIGARHHNVARHEPNDAHAKRASSGRCKIRSTSTVSCCSERCLGRRITLQSARFHFTLHLHHYLHLYLHASCHFYQEELSHWLDHGLEWLGWEQG